MTPYYRHAGITIYHGDCLEVMPSLGKFDLLLTDPPYGIGAAHYAHFGEGVKRHMSGVIKGPAIQKKGYGDSDWDDKPADLETIKAAMVLAAHQIVWGGNYFDLGPARCVLVWDKLRGDTDYADAELAWTNLDRSVRVIRHKWNGFLKAIQEDRFHPTQKPLAVMKWAIQQPKETCESILDPFMGSGTTLRAAKDLGRSAVGIEIEERYCEIAAKRLSQEVFAFGESRTVEVLGFSGA